MAQVLEERTVKQYMVQAVIMGDWVTIAFSDDIYHGRSLLRIARMENPDRGYRLRERTDKIRVTRVEKVLEAEE